jgi:hypothetical protein
MLSRRLMLRALAAGVAFLALSRAAAGETAARRYVVTVSGMT